MIRIDPTPGPMIGLHEPRTLPACTDMIPSTPWWVNALITAAIGFCIAGVLWGLVWWKGRKP